MQQTVFIVEDSEGAATPLEVALQAIIGVRVQLFSSARDALDHAGEYSGSSWRPGDRSQSAVHGRL